jgi:hypothetical protein
LRCIFSWSITLHHRVFRYRRFDTICLSPLQRNSSLYFELSFWIESLDHGLAGPKRVADEVKSVEHPNNNLHSDFCYTTNLELRTVYSASWRMLAGCLLRAGNLSSEEYHINEVDSTKSGHVATQSATIGFHIGKHIFLSIEKTPTDWSFMTATDGNRVAVSKTCDGFETASVVTENITRFY